MTHDNDNPVLLGQRKVDHLNLCNDADVESRGRTTLLEQVHLMHDSLPELSFAQLNTEVALCGRTLRAPLMVSGMTGGADVAREINRTIARVAERYGLAFGVGSQRAMLRDLTLTASYEVRDVAPDVVLFGNIGAVQAASSSTAEIRELVKRIGADALCVHLNPGQEMIQEHGDRDFRGCIDAIDRLANELDVPVIAKETGCGMSRRTLARLRQAGITTVDVSGTGGTTWVGVEALRARGAQAQLGELLWNWGVPTAPSVAWAAQSGMITIASGGIRNGLDAARAIVLGATVASSALPWLRATMTRGAEGAQEVAEEQLLALRTVMLLTGSADVAALQRAPRVYGDELQRWLNHA
jgi:isopentenyl-diphosphate Delta-isomerase